MTDEIDDRSRERGAISESTNEPERRTDLEVDERSTIRLRNRRYRGANGTLERGETTRSQDGSEANRRPSIGR
jgi:hypothetical protein